MPRTAPLLLLLLLPGCQMIPPATALAIGGVLTGVAGVTNADVNAFQAYIDWRKGQAVPVTAVVGTP